MTRGCVSVLWLVSTVAVARAQAHHSISAVYDSAQQITVEGRVTEFQFVNPHPVLIIDAADEGGSPELWRLEMDNRSELAGIGIDSATFKPGDRVVARGSAGRGRERQQSLYLLQLDRPADGLRYEQIGSRPQVNLEL
jgi:Family of unknown function (DUF6152)